MRSRRLFVVVASIVLALFGVRSAGAQQLSPSPSQLPVAAPPAYGAPITLDAAMKVLAAAKKEADKHGWPVAVAVVDGAGYLVAFQRLENTQLGSVEVAIAKARSAALFRRPTKVFEDILAGGGSGRRVLKLEGAMPVDGGLPIVVGGKLIGAIGVSGVQSSQDAEVAAAGLAALK